MSRLDARWLGRLAFDRALELQLAHRERVLEGDPGCVFTVEHPPSLTVGRRGRRSDVLWSEDELVGRGVSVFETPRGGEVTLHAPGQLVIYPVVYVGRRIRAQLETLASVTIEMLADLGVSGARYRPDQPGVWVGDDKIASMGLHIRQGVAVQGLSVNLHVDPELFGALVSCGMPEVRIVNAIDVGGRVIAVDEAAKEWTERYAKRVDMAVKWQTDPIESPTAAR